MTQEGNEHFYLGCVENLCRKLHKHDKGDFRELEEYVSCARKAQSLFSEILDKGIYNEWSYEQSVWLEKLLEETILFTKTTRLESLARSWTGPLWIDLMVMLKDVVRKRRLLIEYKDVVSFNGMCLPPDQRCFLSRKMYSLKYQIERIPY